MPLQKPSHHSLTQTVENLKADFQFLVNTAVWEEDFQVIADALDKAFATVPAASSLPSVKQEADKNMALAQEELERFFSSVKGKA